MSDDRRSPPLERMAHALERTRGLDRAVAWFDAAARPLAAPGRTHDLLTGRWLGHTVHPVLTDLPIGFWTSAFVLDLAGARARASADAMVTLGVLSALPTIATGAADLTERSPRSRRAGVVHLGANLAATALYAASCVARRRERRAVGVGLAFAGATAATVGGMLGGHLAFGSEAEEETMNGEEATADREQVIAP